MNNCEQCIYYNYEQNTKLFGHPCNLHGVFIDNCNNFLKQIIVPNKCPICGGETKIKDNDDVLTVWCTNPDCEGKIINKIEHLLSKKGLDVKGISKATIEKLVDWGWINNLEDIFTLKNHYKEWVQKPGFGEKSVQKILDAIENGKECDLWQFISCLGIPLIGSTVAKDLANYFKCWGGFRNAIDDGFDFEVLPNFGYAMNKSLHDYDWSIADKLISYGFSIHNVLDNPTEKTLEDLTLPFENKIFVITGRLQLIQNREKLINIVEKNGGKVSNSISSKTSVLINNDINSSSTKNKKAKELNIPIITEEEFLKQCVIKE